MTVALGMDVYETVLALMLFEENGALPVVLFSFHSASLLTAWPFSIMSFQNRERFLLSQLAVCFPALRQRVQMLLS